MMNASQWLFLLLFLKWKKESLLSIHTNHFFKQQQSFHQKQQPKIKNNTQI